MTIVVVALMMRQKVMEELNIWLVAQRKTVNVTNKHELAKTALQIHANLSNHASQWRSLNALNAVMHENKDHIEKTLNKVQTGKKDIASS